MRTAIKITYYLPNQSELFSHPQTFTTKDGKEYERIVNICHENNYKIVKVERV